MNTNNLLSLDDDRKYNVSKLGHFTISREPLRCLFYIANHDFKMLTFVADKNLEFIKFVLNSRAEFK